MHPFNKTLLAATIASLCSVSNVYAETEKTSEAEAELTVNVTDTREDELSTKQTLDADDIKDTPSSNGNLTDYLKDNPNVRFAGGDLDGLQGGEIKPSSISINGADPEQTAYLINGINVNNDIDPTGGLFDGSMAVNPNKSSEQAYFFDANLLSGITAIQAIFQPSLVALLVVLLMQKLANTVVKTASSFIIVAPNLIGLQFISMTTSRQQQKLKNRMAQRQHISLNIRRISLV